MWFRTLPNSRADPPVLNSEEFMEIKKVINNVKAVVAGADTVVAETFDRLFDDNHDLVRLQKQNKRYEWRLRRFICKVHASTNGEI